jgi:hypothetical protein
MADKCQRSQKSGVDLEQTVNRLFKNRLEQTTAEHQATAKTHPVYRPTKRLRRDADSLLRETAYVLHLVRTVREQIVSV